MEKVVFEQTIEGLAARCCDLWMNEVGPYPTFTAGLMHAALSSASVEPTISVQSFDGHACTYRCEWKPRSPAP